MHALKMVRCNCRHTATAIFNVLTLALSTSIVGLVLLAQLGVEKLLDGVPQDKYSVVGVDTADVCYYLYALGGVGVLVCIGSLAKQIHGACADDDRPGCLDSALRLFGVIWWVFGAIVVWAFVSPTLARTGAEGAIVIPHWDGSDGKPLLALTSYARMFITVASTVNAIM